MTRQDKYLWKPAARPSGYLMPPHEIHCEVWETLLRMEIRNRRGATWRIADLLNYGETRYGDAYERAVEATGLSYQTWRT